MNNASIIFRAAKESSYRRVANEIGEAGSSGSFLYDDLFVKLHFCFTNRNGVCENSYQRASADRSGGGKICCPVSGASIGVFVGFHGKMYLVV